MKPYEKKIDTIRISVTDRCNLRCVYCMPPQGITQIPVEEILDFTEIVRIVRACCSLGVAKVKVTGGEPLVRNNLDHLIRILSSIPGIEDLSLTTNGVQLAGKAKALQEAGLRRATVSMDSLKPERYRDISGYDALDKVWKGIDTLYKLGMAPVKLNVVMVRGVNDDEIVDFARFTVSRDIEVRFIERMPVGSHLKMRRGCGLWEREGLSSKEIINRIEQSFGPLKTTRPAVSIPGPARLFRLPGGKGRIGVISPVTQPFCSRGSRIRLTPEGRLRTCLFKEKSLDLKTLLRKGISDKNLMHLIDKTIRKKPRLEMPDFHTIKTPMLQIGG